MKKEEVQEIFLKIMREEEDMSAAVAAIRTLLTVIENYKVATVRELDLNLQLAVEAMRHCDQPVTAISSGCELFMRFITLAKLDVKSFDECEQIMLQRGHIFLDTLLEARGKVAQQAVSFITDGCMLSKPAEGCARIMDSSVILLFSQNHLQSPRCLQSVELWQIAVPAVNFP